MIKIDVKTIEKIIDFLGSPNFVGILSLLTGMSAIFSPILLAVVNHRHERKLKSMDLFFNSQVEAYKDFVFCASRLPKNPTDAELLKVYNSTMYATLFSSDDTLEKLGLCSAAAIANTDSPEDVMHLANASRDAIFAMRKELRRTAYRPRR